MASFLEPYKCRTCHLRLTTPKQSKDDKNFVHFGTQSWTCTAIDGVEAALARLYPKVLNQSTTSAATVARYFRIFQYNSVSITWSTSTNLADVTS